jgi:hypothetical protein
VLGMINGWSKAKKRLWLADNKAKVSAINIDKKEKAKELAAFMAPTYEKIIEETGKRRMALLKTAHTTKVKLLKADAADEPDFTYDAEDETMRSYLGSRLKIFSESVEGTTFDDISAALRESFEENETVATISQKLRDMFSDYSDKGRADNIARTESQSASTKADLEAVKQTGLDYKKGWIHGENPRDSHVQAEEDYGPDGDPGPIDLDEEFKIGDDSMDSPCNGSDAAECCGCNCSMYYSESKEE